MDHLQCKHDDVNLDQEVRLELKSKNYDFQTYYDAATLVFAALQGNDVVIKKLLDAGVNADSKFRGGETALMYAARKHHLAIVQLLLDAGADVNANDNISVLEYAIYDRHTYDSDEDVALTDDEIAASETRYRNRVETVKLLLAKGANANSKNCRGQSVLITAVEQGSVDIVKLLIEAGADRHQRNANNLTMAGLARQRSHYDVATFLETLQ